MTASTAWAGCCLLAMKDGIGCIDRQPDGIYRRKIDDQWKIVMGGSKSAKVNDAPELPPYGIYVEYNGWPAGIVEPGGGVIAAGEAANEDTFIAALENAIGSTIDEALSAAAGEK